MKQKIKKNITLSLLSIFCCISTLFGRSVHRKSNPFMPEITTYWQGDTQTYTLKESHLQEYPIFRVTAHANDEYRLPHTGITYGNHLQHTLPTNTINELIEHLLTEIYTGKKTFTHFTLIHENDYNPQKKCGFIVFKFNEYPFVLKLSLETPQTFIDPYSKGFIPTFFFFMAGGSNRHLTGLTRIKNMYAVKEKIAQHPQWAGHVIVPRKWFWTPKNNRSFIISGKNIGNHKTIQTEMPSVYGIIAEMITKDDSVTISLKNRKKIVIQLCNDLDLIIDPHISNYIFSKDPLTGKNIITIIDTEHFPTLVGIKEKEHFNGINRWYLNVTVKCFKDMYLRSKEERILAQTHITPYSLF
jgi:hypothetical protein